MARVRKVQSRTTHPSTEVHQFKFRGTLLPPSAYRLLVEKKLNNTQIILALIVDAFSDGDGCYASNRYLAEQIGTQPHYVSQMISEMVKMGIVRSRQIAEKRHLFINWPKDPPVAGNDTPPVAGNDTISNTNTKKNSRPAKSGGEREKGENMGFLKQYEKPKSRDRHNLQADLLHGAVISKTSHKQKWVRSSWAKEFALLESQVGEDRVRKTLAWITVNIGKQYVPTVYCAKTFRKKFARLEDAMKREEERNPMVVVSDEAKELAKQIKGWGWPKPIENLPASVQLSMDNYSKFRKWLKKQENKVQPQVMFFFVRHLNESLPSSLTFVKNWFEDMHGRVSNWDGWSGNVMAGVIKVGSAKFQDMGKEMSIRYAGTAARWEELMETYNR